eukprot:TRINITY_DN55360_c0_g2_i1.p3 TRINITY_DN55360_c0_g2~~TRINITY_DN55360_c0_g2_i1.p3  ORF type:complete len:100 (+),score=17.18 TRINITY_DN55360_c0_g2_i1:201-500(+)
MMVPGSEFARLGGGLTTLATDCAAGVPDTGGSGTGGTIVLMALGLPTCRPPRHRFRRRASVRSSAEREPGRLWPLGSPDAGQIAVPGCECCPSPSDHGE